jgi:CheY-like chemotaxis protein
LGNHNIIRNFVTPAWHLLFSAGGLSGDGMRDQTILVVDDEQSIREVFSEAFERQGYTVITAESGEVALEIMSESPCWVLFLDLNLPGMDGIELCQRIRKEWPMAIPYAVTGYASVFELANCRDAGFEDYFTKPVSLNDLYDAVENAFSKLDRWRSK